MRRAGAETVPKLVEVGKRNRLHRVIVEPTPEYSIGGPDNVLTEAIIRLGNR
jgi:hypothetical protein